MFSIAGTLRSWVVVFQIYDEEGMYGMVCSDRMYVSDIARFWTLAFTISKFFEFSKLVVVTLYSHVPSIYDLILTFSYLMGQSKYYCFGEQTFFIFDREQI